MASIDKIYGNKAQFQELHDFIALKYPEFLKYLYYRDWDCEDSEDILAIANFPSRLDDMLIEDKNTPKFVRDRLKEQYSIDY